MEPMSGSLNEAYSTVGDIKSRGGDDLPIGSPVVLGSTLSVVIFRRNSIGSHSNFRGGCAAEALSSIVYVLVAHGAEARVELHAPEEVT